MRCNLTPSWVACPDRALPRHAQKTLQDDVEIKRLRRVGQLLGRFTKDEGEYEPLV